MVPKMVLKSGPKSRRQKSGPYYYSFFVFVYGFWHRFRCPELGPLMSFKSRTAQALRLSCTCPRNVCGNCFFFALLSAPPQS